MMECSKCKKVLAKKGSHFLCQGPCQGTYHRSCVKGLAADIRNGRNRIYCNNCKDEGSEEEEQRDESQEFSMILRDIQKKVCDIPGFKKKLDSITLTLSMLSERYDTLITEHEESKIKINKLEKTITSVSNKCIFLEKSNAYLEQRIQEFEQSTRKNNVEIIGIEQLPNENVKEIVTSIGEALGVKTVDIEWARRTPSTKEKIKPAPIVVKFRDNATETRDNWLRQRKKLYEVTSNKITGGPAKNRIYMNEDLTKSTRTLLWSTKEKLKGIYRYIWVSNGKILVKKEEGEKTICVRAESDISELLSRK